MRGLRTFALLVVSGALLRSGAPAAEGPAADWPAVGNDPGGQRYSPLREVHRGNVRALKVAWTYRTGDADDRQRTTIECTPVMAEGALFLTTCNPKVKVVALDAATGRERWKFDPWAARGPEPPVITSGGVNRGLAYWSDGRPGGARRILFGAADGRLISLDARTGTPDPAFGKAGTLDLRAGLEGVTREMPYGPTSPPALWRDTVIVGCSCSEGDPPGAPGDVRAFDVRTGAERWRFHTVPRPGEFGAETWPEGAWKGRSGVNPWGGLTVDEARGIVFCGTGSAAHDWYGGDRKGDNLFANCTLALDARTGKRLWHFQTVHHDTWDYDNPCPPVLVRVNPSPGESVEARGAPAAAGGRPSGQRRAGREASTPSFLPLVHTSTRPHVHTSGPGPGGGVDAAAQVTKTGYCFLFDRVSGKPLFPVEERPVPRSEVPGEHSSPTQPFPLKPPPLAPGRVTEADLTDLSPEARAEALERFRQLRSGGPFAPTSLQGTLVSPGWHGGATWSGASFDPTTGFLYVNTNNTPCVYALEKGKGRRSGYYLTSKQALRSRNSPPRYQGLTGKGIADLLERSPETGAGPRHLDFFYFNDKDGYPGVKRPWGSLTAIDLNRGEFAWRVPLGEYPELAAKGIPRTGTENFGGSICTAGGLVFIGAAQDERLHAFDSATGALLWEHALPAGGYATPCTYAVDGRQYVVIAAGGGGKLHTKSGDAFVAFALKA